MGKYPTMAYKKPIWLLKGQDHHGAALFYYVFKSLQKEIFKLPQFVFNMHQLLVVVYFRVASASVANYQQQKIYLNDLVSKVLCYQKQPKIAKFGQKQPKLATLAKHQASPIERKTLFSFSTRCCYYLPLYRHQCYNICITLGNLVLSVCHTKYFFSQN